MISESAAPKDVPQVAVNGSAAPEPGEGTTVTLNGGELSDYGYILGSASNDISGDQYRWVPGHGPDETALAATPQWLVDFVEKSRPGISDCDPQK